MFRFSTEFEAEGATKMGAQRNSIIERKWFDRIMFLGKSQT